MALRARSRLLSQITILHGSSIVSNRLPINGYCIKKTQKPDNEDDDDNDNVPIKFSTSNAAKWKALDSFNVVTDENRPPKYESLVVRLSVGLFLIYFCILREESDIDIDLVKPLPERFEEQKIKYDFPFFTYFYLLFQYID
uniref:Uncharacterized protein n=1 Tax=Strigamia maritima TaxID=126957 RepID=T1J1V6_STRMM